jgi:hypothetical protein
LKKKEDMQIRYAGKLLVDGEFADPSIFDGRPPRVSWSATSDVLHTLIMWDNDAPNPYPYDTNSPFIHWLMVNIPGDRISFGSTVIPYIDPSPPGPAPHRYYIQIFEQSQRETIYIDPKIVVRRVNFPLQSFVRDYDLSLLYQFNFLTEPNCDTMVKSKYADPVFVCEKRTWSKYLPYPGNGSELDIAQPKRKPQFGKTPPRIQYNVYS